MSQSVQCLQHIFAVGILAIFQLAASHADDWPAWRGPKGNGISTESVAPMMWSATENIAWRTEIPGHGRSSPIVTGDRVFVTTGVDEDQSRRVICIDRGDGRMLWSKSVHTGPGGKMHQDNTMASSTPVTDGERVFAAFVDDQGMKVVALDMDGNVLWNANPGTYFSNHGFAASPVIYGDGVIINGHQDGTAFVVMLDRRTGSEVWRYTPAINQRSFSTPVLTQYDGEDQLILTGSQQTLGLNPSTGELLWNASGPTEKFVCTPSAGHGMVFSFGGSPEKKSLAVKLGGTGDVSETHVVWRSERGMPYVPSPLLVGDYLHIINDLGVYTCIEPVSGKVLHTARALGSTYSSPIAVGDRIYMFEDTGECTIFENRPGFHVLAKNSLDEEMYTTPAMSNGQLFVRTTTALVCISESEQDGH
jgi:outer membrane protein assembly factor BamB